ncbi:putative quinol monooxygenase [Celeribacter arenosi]|uniref:Antibiotic biosynthesis monooxygenase n=1 Tax=Celeribacter arenosi TaxID=792649 RepID=A0ABP7KGU4_9RHOB
MNELIAKTGRVSLTGQFKCPPAEVPFIRKALERHIVLTRQEPGCLHFDVSEDAETVGLFHVTELFVDGAAFEHHGTRTRESQWWKASGHLPRAFTVKQL